MEPDRDGLEEVLEYLARLDDRLEDDLSVAERKLVRRDLRRLVEDLAFRMAFTSGRPAPDDIDYVRALEAMKPPPAAAEVVRRQRPAYRRRARAGLARKLVGWGVFLAGVLFLATLSSTETNVFLGEYAEGRAPAATESDVLQVAVPEGLERVYLVVQAVVRDEGSVTVTVLDPEGQILYQREFTRDTVAYDDRNLPAPPGTWTVLVDYKDAAANVRVRLNGVQAA